MTPQQFIHKWRRTELGERSASHQHFLDLCELLDLEKPAEADPEGAHYAFERGVHKTGGGDGWADVWKRGCFGWEYKRKGNSLDDAYRQLLQYREDLDNPPLLIVSDINRIQVHTNFTGTKKQVYEVDLYDLDKPDKLDVVRRAFLDPHSFHPERMSVRITEEASALFGRLADQLRQRGVAAPDAAHFLMKLIFCYFAEDIELLPKNFFTRLLKNFRRKEPRRLANQLRQLFRAMARGDDLGADEILHFNGGLFADDEAIELREEEVDQLLVMADYDWSKVEPSIFGTLFERTLDPEKRELFERTLDPDKREKIGIHYTSKKDIIALVEPVLMTPLRREWDEIRKQCDALWREIQQGARKSNGPRRSPPRERTQHDELINGFLERLAQVRVLDPACGSGNFLYVAIHLLLDLENEVLAFAAKHSDGIMLPLTPHVRPTQLHGLEINPYAQQLAQVVIWIGYLQWMREHGFSVPSDPVLEPIESITLKDAILDFGSTSPSEPRALATGSRRSPQSPREPVWPEADVVIGNPPFLGGKLLRDRLGDDYVDAMFTVWDGRVPREADLCCYWFEKARAMIEQGKLKRAGLLATQGIRGGANREVLKRIKETGDIFFAISDREWMLDGANVHISLVGFDDGSDRDRLLDFHSIPDINPDLSSRDDLTTAGPLPSNANISFQGTIKDGPFEIDNETAERMLAAPNPHQRSNREVVIPWINGSHLTGRVPQMWIIDFGASMSLEDAALFEMPFQYVVEHVKSVRKHNRDQGARERWWLHIRPRPGMREAIKGFDRVICTPRVAKHRIFVWISGDVLADSATYVFARDDDYFFGVLHSTVHERWARRTGTQLREAESGFRYTPTTCFETFPFPPQSGGIGKGVPSKREFQDAPDGYDPKQARKLRSRIAAAAVKLHELRENWFNPKTPDESPALTEAQLKKRTLTNLYNERPTWLELAHLELDRAVLAAYGWPEEWGERLQPQRDEQERVNPVLGVTAPAVEQELLSRLLALNSAGQDVR